jgi:single-strand DNA-binding protein
MQKNRIELAGYIAARPQIRFLPSGTKVANARLGETYRYTNGDGKSVAHTNWHNLVFYGELASVAETYNKGDNIEVEGSVQQRKFTPADGSPRTVHEIIVRACHLIAPPRKSDAAAQSEDVVEREEALDEWPA